MSVLLNVRLDKVAEVCRVDQLCVVTENVHQIFVLARRFLHNISCDRVTSMIEVMTQKIQYLLGLTDAKGGTARCRP